MTQTTQPLDVMELVSDIVSAYLSNNSLEPEEIPAFVRLVKKSLLNLEPSQKFVMASNTEPAVPIEKSVTPDYIICLEDGKRMKMLKRHLRATYNMTPDEYRERWGLPVNYPMVAPNYAKTRQGIARSIGLGTHRKGKGKKQTAA